MKTPDQEALEFLNKYSSARVQIKHHELSLLIKRIRVEQDKKTRKACAKAMKECDKYYDNTLIYEKYAIDACMNVKAV